MTQFSYRTSHDLKAPLSTTKGLLRFILDDLASGNLDEVKRNARVAIEQVTRLENLVVDLLDMARMDIAEEGSALIDFKEIIEELRVNFLELAKESNVDIISEIDVRRDCYLPKVKLSQILANLVSNGLKYCDAKPRRTLL